MESHEAHSIETDIKHSSLRALAHKNFRLFFIGQTISMIGTWSQTLAISWLIWKLTHSAFWLGLSGFTMQFPMLILGLVGGVFADKYNRHKFLTILQAICMLQALLLAVLTYYTEVSAWMVIALGSILGITYAFEFPVRQSFVADMVGKRDLLNAVSLVAGMFHATRAIGPSIAGFIVAWKGEVACFSFNALTFIPLIAALMIIDRRLLYHADREPKSMLPAINEALRELKRDSRFALATATISTVAIFVMPVIFLMPIFADSIIGGGAITLGWLMATSGIGSLFGAVWLSRRKTSEGLTRLAGKSLIGASLFLISFALSKDLTLSLASLFGMGFCTTVIVSAVMTVTQNLAPNHLRGRMMSIVTTAFMGLAPIGSIFSGIVAKKIGAPVTISICGLISFTIGIISWSIARKIHRTEISNAK